MRDYVAPQTARSKNHRSCALAILIVMLSGFDALAKTDENTASVGITAQNAAARRGIIMSAVVRSDATLARGRYAISARRGDVPTGSYVVRFKYNISACTYVATIGAPGNFGIEDPAIVTVVRRDREPQSIYLAVFGIDGTSRPDRGVHVVVRC